MNDYSYSAKYSVDSLKWHVVKTNKNGEEKVIRTGLEVFDDEKIAKSKLPEGKLGLVKVDDKSFELVVVHHNELSIKIKSVAIEKLVVADKTVNSKNLSKKLVEAYKNGQLDEVDLMLSSGLNFKHLPTSFIADCIRKNHISLLTKLFDAGYTFPKQNKEIIYQAVLEAAKADDWDVAFLCVDKGHLDIQDIQVDQQQTPINLLNIACEQLNAYRAKQCIDYGLVAKDNALNLIGVVLSNMTSKASQKSLLSMLVLLNKQNVKIFDQKNPNPLTLIAQKNLYNKNNLMLADGILGFAKDEYDALDDSLKDSAKRALSLCVFELLNYCDVKDPQNPYRNLALSIVNDQIDPNAKKDGLSLAHLATTQQDIVMIDALLKLGIDPLVRDSKGFNCLDLALKGFSEVIVQRLLQEPFDINENNSGLTPLQQAVQTNNPRFVKLLIDKGAIAKDALNLALDLGNLEIIELLDPQFSMSDYLSQLINKNGDIQIEFSKFFMNSPLDKVYNQLKNSRYRVDLLDTLKKLIKIQPLIARFNTQKFAKEMQNFYGNTGNFISQQIKYGEQILDTVNNTTVDEDIMFTFKDYALARSNIAKNNNDKNFEDYSIVRYEDDVNLITPLGSYQRPTRYTGFLPLVESTYDDVLNHRGIGHDVTEKNKFNLGYEQLYETPDGEFLQLTSVTINRSDDSPLNLSNWTFNHANYDVGLDGLKELNRLVDALYTAKSPVDKYNLIAEIFWLGSNVTLFNRGSAQYMQMLTQKMVSTFGLIPLIPKIEYPLPDCVALAIPCDEFISTFFDYFEPISTVLDLMNLKADDQ
ncbi:MAG: ankyrin repeat domain-containing protein [Parachlamydiales bacterium]|nr:ankyrin repeat domain-containing protein [Parachlamydiales bacterium]